MAQVDKDIMIVSVYLSEVGFSENEDSVFMAWNRVVKYIRASQERGAQPAQPHNTPTTPFIHCVHCVHLSKSMHCLMDKCVNVRTA